MPASRQNSRSPSPDAAHAAKKRKGPNDIVVATLDPNERDAPAGSPIESPTIDEPESRPKLPLPQRTPTQQAMNSAPFVVPDPHDMTDLPTLRGENPHMQTTQPDPIPAALPDADRLPVPFTFAVFPRVVIPFGALTHNMAPAQVNSIKADPTKYLAILPHGAGKKFYLQNPHANREARAFIETIKTDNISVEGMDIALPISRHHPKRDFDGPWPMIMSGASPALTEFLLWHQTFSVNKRLNFHVIRFDPDLDSWVVMTISGDAVNEGEAAMLAVMGVIKRVLWYDPRFRIFVNNVLSAAGVVGSIDQRVVRATETFELTLVRTSNQHGVDTPLFQLTAKPITRDPELHRQWLALIRSPPGGYVVKMHALIIDRRFVDCIWCKGKMHPGHGCPFHSTPGWLGAIPDPSARHDDLANGTSANDDDDDDHHPGRGRGRTNSDRRRDRRDDRRDDRRNDRRDDRDGGRRSRKDKHRASEDGWSVVQRRGGGHGRY